MLLLMAISFGTLEQHCVPICIVDSLGFLHPWIWINVPGFPLIVHLTYCYQRLPVLELWNRDCVNTHAHLMFQSLKMFCRLALSRWCGYRVIGSTFWKRLSESSYSLLSWGSAPIAKYNLCLKISSVTCQSFLIGIKLGIHEGRFHNQSMSKVEHLHISPPPTSILQWKWIKSGFVLNKRELCCLFFNSTGVMVGSWMFCIQKFSWLVSF